MRSHQITQEQLVPLGSDFYRITLAFGETALRKRKSLSFDLHIHAESWRSAIAVSCDGKREEFAELADAIRRYNEL